jgi:16S rRNA (guanine966-N2)-methyltransferase
MGRARGRKNQANAPRSVRIVAGIWRGHLLKAPAAQTTRPTTDRVKEAMMSSIFSARGGFDGAQVLDAFAGSGALGLEALSRGAAHVRFCEADAAALRILQGNIASLDGAAEHVDVRRGDAFKAAGAALAQPFDLVLLDPPYATPAEQVADFIEGLRASGALAPDALVCYEHAESDDSAVRSECERIQWNVLKSKSYGDIAFSLLRKECE